MNLDIYPADLAVQIMKLHPGTMVNARKFMGRANMDKVRQHESGMPFYEFAPRDSHTKKFWRAGWNSERHEFTCECNHFKTHKDEPDIVSRVCAHIYFIVAHIRHPPPYPLLTFSDRERIAVPVQIGAHQPREGV